MSDARSMRLDVLVAARGLAASRAQARGAWLIALIKPQFEAGRAAIGKGGIVRDQDDRDRAVSRVKTCLSDQPGWICLDVIASPITGSGGNQDYLLGAQFEGNACVG